MTSQTIGTPAPPPSPPSPLPSVQAPRRLAPQPLGGLRRALAVGIVRLARRLMPPLVKLAGDRCWDCGKRITPTTKLPSYQIVEARIWAWEEVVCDTCVRARLTRFGGRGPKH